jgi:hypothetical protein
MFEISHVLVLSQPDFVERRVCNEIGRVGVRWTRLWPFGRRGAAAAD